MQIPVLVGILTTLLSCDQVNATTLAEKYEMSKRSVYRYISALSESGVPIYAKAGRNGGWAILDNYKLKSIYFTRDEYSRMLFCVKSFNVQDSLTRDIVDKLNGLTRNTQEGIVLQSNQLIVDTTDNQNNQNKLDILQKALSKYHLVNMEYHDQKGQVTNRIVEPYCLVLKNNVWYLYAYCTMRQDFRFFKLSRIAQLITDKRTYKPRKFSVDCSVIESDMIKGKEQCEVLLSIQPSALTAVEEWVGIDKVARMGERYYASVEMPYDDVLINKILSFGSGVCVQKPLRLAQAVKQRCMDIVNNYNDV